MRSVDSTVPPASGDVPWSSLRRLTRQFRGAHRALLQFSTGESGWKPRLVAQIDARPSQRILNIESGPGTVAIAVKRAQPQASLVCPEVEADVRENARAHAESLGLQIDFPASGVNDAIFQPASFDTAVCTLHLHHLDAPAKDQLLSRVCELLKPGGRLEIADWGKAHDGLMRGAFLIVQTLDGKLTTEDNVRGLIPEYVSRAGFTSVRETYRQRTPLGTISLYSAVKPIE